MNKSIFLIGIAILLIGSVSAFEFDNVKEINKSGTTFDMLKDTITIRNSILWVIPLSKIADVKMLYNEVSLIEGEAAFEMNIYQDYDNPVSQIKFEDALGRNVEGDVFNYKWYYYDDKPFEVDVPTYKQVCESLTDSKNGTKYDKCDYVQDGTHKETRRNNQWVEYKGGTFKEGKWIFKIVGQRKANSKVDFIPNLFGVELEEYAWWDITWGYKKEIKVQENQNENYTDFSMNITIPYNANMQADFDDLRFTNVEQNAELPYWIPEHFDSAQANVTVKIPRLNNSINSSIYMYYGNNAVGNKSNYTLAYLWADHFVGADWNTYYVNNSETGESVINTAGTGTIAIKGGADSFVVRTRNNYTNDSGGEWMLEALGQSNSAVAGNYIGIGTANQWGANKDVDAVDGNKNGTNLYWQTNTPVWRLGRYRSGAYSQTDTSNANSPVVAQRTIRLNYNNTNDGYTKGYSDGTLLGTYGVSFGTPPAINRTDAGIFMFGRTGATFTVDYVRLQRWASNWPTYTFGTEEELTPPSGLTVSLTTPDNLETPNSSLMLNATSLPVTLNITNATLYIWNYDKTLFNRTPIDVTLGYNDTNYTITSLFIGNYSWNYLFCGTNATGTLCNMSLTNYTFNVKPTAYASATYNVIEGGISSHTLYLNMSGISSYTVNTWIIWNGTNYGAGTSSTINANSIRIDKNITLPDIGHLNANVTWDWYYNISYGATMYSNHSNLNSSQNYSQLVMSQCTDSVTQKVLNITFKDEVTSARINATIDSSWDYNLLGGSTKSFSFANTSHNMEYDFCVYPNFMPYTLYASSEITYAKSEGATYPQRATSIVNETFSNSTITNKTLYLLNYNDGVTSTFQVITVGNQIIEGAYIVVQRTISGNTTTVASGYTDSAGLISFFLNPNYDHIITITKDGYASQTQTIKPQALTYTITMGGSSSYFNYSNQLHGIRYKIWPPSGPIEDGTYNYSFEVYSRTDNIYNCSFSVRLPNGTIYGNASGCNAAAPAMSNGGKIATMINVTYARIKWNITHFKGDYYITTSGNNIIRVEGDAQWKNVNINKTDYFGSFNNFLNETYYLPEWGDNPQTNDYSRIVFFFIFFAIVIAMINRYSSYDTAYPGAIIWVVTGVVILLSAFNGITGPGFFYLDGATNTQFFCDSEVPCFSSKVMDNWMLAIQFIMLSLIQLFTSLKRYQSG